MASSKDYLNFILEELSSLDEISYSAMMGEYIIYYHGKLIGGIYDDRFLVKLTKSSISLMPQAIYESPYKGSKNMLLVDTVVNRDFLKQLFAGIYNDLPDSKTKRKTKYKQFKNLEEINYE